MMNLSKQKNILVKGIATVWPAILILLIYNLISWTSWPPALDTHEIESLQRSPVRFVIEYVLFLLIGGYAVGLVGNRSDQANKSNDNEMK